MPARHILSTQQHLNKERTQAGQTNQKTEKKVQHKSMRSNTTLTRSDTKTMNVRKVQIKHQTELSTFLFQLKFEAINVSTKSVFRTLDTYLGNRIQWKRVKNKFLNGCSVYCQNVQQE